MRPAKVLAALEWLKRHNILYKDIEINPAWLHDAAEDMQICGQHCQHRPVQWQDTVGLTLKCCMWKIVSILTCTDWRGASVSSFLAHKYMPVHLTCLIVYCCALNRTPYTAGTCTLEPLIVH